MPLWAWWLVEIVGISGGGVLRIGICWLGVVHVGVVVIVFFLNSKFVFLIITGLNYNIYSNVKQIYKYHIPYTIFRSRM